MLRQILILVSFFLFKAGYSQNPGVDFLRGKIKVIPKPDSSEIDGEVIYTFFSEGIADSIFIDARNMKIAKVWIQNDTVGWNYDGRQVKVKAPDLGGNYTIGINYKARPRQALYFLGWDFPLNGKEQIWTQGQGKYSSNWVPSFDSMTEKIVFDLSVTFQKEYSIMANGVLKAVSLVDSLKLWEFEMKQPMSSYLLAFTIGKFDSITQISNLGIPLTLYFPVGKGDIARNTYRFNKEIFDFLEQEIGVFYPWQNYKQVPVRDFMYAGMENTGLTLFDDSYLVDSIAIRDHDYLEVNAHELAHQWFGNLVTETDASQHWLHEGFATFYSYKTAAEFLGNEYLTWKLYNTFLELGELDQNNEGASLLNPEAGSLIFYEKGAWALFALEDLLGGKAFRLGIKTYLDKFSFQNATVDDFLGIMERSSGISLSHFKEEWLISETFPLSHALNILKNQSRSFTHFLNLSKGDELFKDKTLDFLNLAWEAYPSSGYKAAILDKFFKFFDSDLLLRAIKEEDAGIQKIILSRVKDLGIQNRTFLYPYLEAPSYEVRYHALLQLWLLEDTQRRDILNTISGNGSLSDERIHQLWLTLGIITDGYFDDVQRKDAIRELNEGTSSRNNWSIRQHGFELLSEIKAINIESIPNLIEGTEHHAWQFRIFCRRLLDRMLEDVPDANFWKRFAEKFSENSFPYFYSKLNRL